MPVFTFTVDYERECSVPGRWAICERCNGDGGVDCFEGGFSMHDEFVDQDFLDDYRAGVYTKTCPECHGSGKIVEPVPEQFTLAQGCDFALHQEEQQARWEIDAEMAAERAMGA